MLPRLTTTLLTKSTFGRVLPSLRAASSSKALDTEPVNTKEHTAFVADRIGSIVSNPQNRLFAVVHAHQRQFKVSQNDLIQIHYASPLDVGQKIQLEKVLLVGGRDFTIFGRPLLDAQQVKVYATVVEKTVTSPELKYFKAGGKHVKSMDWLSHELTTLRINEIVVDQAALQA
uniref:Large ribosomal subunit protein bL21m n=1 Tax=Panagrellus redivivus TaxID=6233 RepID=A0A7E4UZE8_PANRE